MPACECKTTGHESSCPNSLAAQFARSQAPLQGWICPACGSGNSPYVNRCPCRPIDAATCTTTGPIKLLVETAPLGVSIVNDPINWTPQSVPTLVQLPKRSG